MPQPATITQAAPVPMATRVTLRSLGVCSPAFASSSLRIYYERGLSFFGPVGYNITLGGATSSTS